MEVDYWVHVRLYPEVMVRLLEDIESGAYWVENLRPEEYSRVRQLCAQYDDADIGFVDAAVLTVVERFGETKLATLDHRHFGMLRPRHTNALTLLP